MSVLPAANARALIREAAALPRHEAEWLLSHVTGIAPADLYLADDALAPDAAARFHALAQARQQGAPIQYLVGWAGFYGRRFRVEPGVFIPRPETESVVAAALALLRERQQALGRPLRVLDAGTGSGAIAVTLACELPACLVVAVELSWKAITTARQNALEAGVGSRVSCVRGRWTEALRGGLDAVIANPPYIASEEIDRLPPDVRQEPRLSLDGGRDGLNPYEELLRRLPDAVGEGGIGVFECGEAQVGPLLERCSNGSLTHARPIVDLAGRPRGVACRVR